jgi:hypothetical protein
MPGRKRTPATIWKMVDAQCTQLTDAVAAAKIPFLITLLWAFIWAWSLYSSEFGYLTTFYRTRLDSSLLYKDETATSGALQFMIDCKRVTAGRLQVNESLSPEKQPALSPDQKKDCEKSLTERRSWAEKAYLDSTAMSFPGGFQKVEESDLGVIGQCGLILLLAWLFYAQRRETHAIQTFVDVNSHTRHHGTVFTLEFVLEPQNDFLSAEHLAYAYHAVAQRFLLIFARFATPLLTVTILLLAIPAIVATLHVLGDPRDAAAYQWVEHLTARFVFEVILLIIVWFVTLMIIKYVIESSRLLAAWSLASKEVWLDEWDENTDHPASKVKVNIRNQTAEKLK